MSDTKKITLATTVFDVKLSQKQLKELQGGILISNHDVQRLNSFLKDVLTEKQHNRLLALNIAQQPMDGVRADKKMSSCCYINRADWTALTDFLRVAFMSDGYAFTAILTLNLQIRTLIGFGTPPLKPYVHVVRS